MLRCLVVLLCGMSIVLSGCAAPAAPTAVPATSVPVTVAAATAVPPTSVPATTAPTVVPPTVGPTARPTRTATPAPTGVPYAFFDFIDSKPIVTRGKAGTWDDTYTDPGAVVYHDGMFHMFRNGFRAWPATVQIGYVTSPDGLTWTKQGDDPVLYTKDVPYAGIAALASSVVVEDDGTWVLYFYTWETRGAPGRSGVGRATAKNPKGPWTVDAELVMTRGSAGEWDDQQVFAPAVLKTSEGYVMYYAGTNKAGIQRIGRATSTDGVHWTKYNDAATTAAPFAESDPVLQPEQGKWDGGLVHQPHVLRMGDGWVMLYRGTPSVGSQSMALGYATSADGIRWTRAADNPILKPNAVPGAQFFWFTNALVKDDTIYFFWEVDIKQKTEIYVATHKGRVP